MLSAAPIVRVVVQDTVAVFGSAGFTSTGVSEVQPGNGAWGTASRLTMATRALVMLPAFGSVNGSTAVMSWIVALRMTDTEVPVTVGVLKNIRPL